MLGTHLLDEHQRGDSNAGVFIHLLCKIILCNLMKFVFFRFQPLQS